MADEISAEFGFRPPQRLALKRLEATLGAFEFGDSIEDIEASLPGAFGFDTQFPSFCFDIATGVGKTRLLAGAINYLLRSGLSRNFFIVAPGETIYSKLLAELEPSSDSYLFAGVGGMDEVRIVTGDDYLYREAVEVTENPATIYVFNIQKLLKGGEKQRYKFHTFQETLGASFADKIRAKGDLVVLMDESHRYRGAEYFASINDLKPQLGLEFTATPIFRKNVIYQYSLKKAIADGWVKWIRPVYRQNDASLDEELDDLKLRDGLMIHEETKQRLELYAEAHDLEPIRPLALVNIEMIDRAKALKQKLEEELGYQGKVLLVHSKRDDLDEQARQLMELEKPEAAHEHEIVVHVNKLREGWDVRNIFTIIPLRASISSTLTAQTIGRGVRLPFAVNNRDDLPDPEIATLRVICYQKGRDNYARIIEESKQLGDLEPEDAEKQTPKEKVTVNLTGAKSQITVPDVETTIETAADLTPFSPKVLISDEKSAAHLREVDVLTGEWGEDLGEATATTLENQSQFIVQSIIDLIPELKQSDVPAVADLTRKYLSAATGSTSQKEWEKYLTEKRKWVRADLLLQVKEHVKQESKVTYKAIKNPVTFEPFATLLPKGQPLREYRSVPNEEIRKSLVGGYYKTIYEGFRFDSQQEKWLADALDADKDVLEWLKVPEGQLVIRTPAGRYLPDFLAKTKRLMYLIEVKDAKSVEEKNPKVVEKARRAAEWCDVLSKASKPQWKYRLLRHDRIKQGDTLEGMLAAAVSLEEFISS